LSDFDHLVEDDRWRWQYEGLDDIAGKKLPNVILCRYVVLVPTPQPPVAAVTVYAYGKKGEEYAFKYGTKPEECVSLGAADALRLFESSVSENGEKPSAHFEKIYAEMSKRLFSKKTEVAMDRGKTDAINKAEALRAKFPEKKDYLEDLLYVMRELDALPDRYAKFIRAIDLKNIADDFKELQKEVPHKYLVNIIEREKQIDEGKESLILSEELI